MNFLVVLACHWDCWGVLPGIWGPLCDIDLRTDTGRPGLGFPSSGGALWSRWPRGGPIPRVVLREFHQESIAALEPSLRGELHTARWEYG